MDLLRAFEEVDFEWTQTLDSVWQDPRYDIPSLHDKQRREVLDKVRKMAVSTETDSPLGWVLVGRAGIGKTHLLSSVRRDVLGVPACFILVNLIDVRDFWESVLLGFIDSLQRSVGSTEITQGYLVVQHLAAQVRGDDGAAMTNELASLPPTKLALTMDELVQRLGRTHRAMTLKHADTLRALVLLNSQILDLSNLGHAWLQGYGVDESDLEKFGFDVRLNIREKRASAVVEGLSWLISLRCPTVIALDQLDAIVVENNVLAAAGDLPEEHAAKQLVSRHIIDGVGRGLMELRDLTRRSLAVVACLEDTWNMLRSTSLKSATHRYDEPRPLGNLRDAEVARHLVRARLEAGFRRAQVSPPHPLWPFSPSAFDAIAGKSPRELLRSCAQHRRKCIDQGRVTELSTFSPDEPPRSRTTPPERAELLALDAELAALRASAKLSKRLLEPDGEDKVGALLAIGCELVVAEQPDDPSVAVVVDIERPNPRHYPALHARVRQILVNDHDRERHFCLRALWKDHPIAFQARLSAAVTASGIDRQIEFRKLLLVRSTPIPNGTRTTAIMAKAKAAGAEMVPASHDDLLVLSTLRDLREAQKKSRELFDQWLRARRHASELALMKPLVEWLDLTRHKSYSKAAPNARPARTGPVAATTNPPAPEPPPPPTMRTSQPPVAPQSPVSPPVRVAPSPSPAHAPVRVELSPVPPPVRVAPPPEAPPTRVSETPPAVPAAPTAVAQPGARATITLGHQLIADRPGAPQCLLAEDLRQHVVVLAGAGSGKTVLLKRLIEECALLGIPSIVVDGANDLARLGEPWPARPPEFTREDDEKAARYHAETDVIVWTPGRSTGNPLRLGLLPDFDAVAHDADDLTQSIAMTASTLSAMARRADDRARAILDSALRVFHQQGGGDLFDFLDLLVDLPEEATLKISTARKVATALSDDLRAAIQTNPLLKDTGEALDPGLLFGVGSARTRVSVLSLIGLPGLEAPLQFINQLAMTLFTWVKKNPCPADRPLRGLLVIDEARDFVPSQGSTPCKESLIRLAAQGRKYGLGVVFATQAPKSIDHNVIANASTHFYGKASSPAAIDTVEEALKQRGASKVDVARLASGRFYFAGKGMQAPVKIAVPLCLSHHPQSPPDEADVLRRAAASRNRVV